MKAIYLVAGFVGVALLLKSKRGAEGSSSGSSSPGAGHSSAGAGTATGAYATPGEDPRAAGMRAAGEAAGVASAAASPGVKTWVVADSSTTAGGAPITAPPLAVAETARPRRTAANIKPSAPVDPRTAPPTRIVRDSGAWGGFKIL